MKRLIDEYLDTTFGHKCIGCGNTVGLERDHVNGCVHDQRLGNFQWLCKPDNTRKQRRQETNRAEADSVNEPVSVSVAPTGERLDPDMDAITINRLKEPRFLKLAAEELASGPMEKRLFIKLMANRVGVSIDTIKLRYLEKHDVTGGLLHVVYNKRVGLEFVELRKRVEE